MFEHAEAMELLKIQKTKDWQLFGKLAFVLGFPASVLSMLMFLRACDEVIFCVSLGYVHAGARLAGRLRPCREM